MGKITSVIFFAFFISFFGSEKSYALDKSGCSKFDLLCKLTGRGAVGSTKTEKVNKSKKVSSQQNKKISNKKHLTKKGCNPLDFLCHVTGKGAVDPNKVEEASSEKNRKQSSQRPLTSKGCVRLDILCHITGKGAQQQDQTTSRTILNKNENDSDERFVMISPDSNTELNSYFGMFDFSDTKQAASLFGFQHQDDELYRNSFLGKVSPITGGFVTNNSAFYLYSGVQWEFDVNDWISITPSFAPGYYNYGGGKDLGYPLEFKSELQMSLNFSENTQMGMSYNHISNASLGTKNPGANSYMFNLLKQF